MKKIVPIILICASALTLLLALAGLILVATAMSVPQIAPIGIATTIIALIPAILCGGLCILFKRDILCRIAFFIALAGFASSVAAIIIWLAAL